VSTTLDQVKQVAVDVFGVTTLPDDASTTSIENWDSVNHLNLVLALESTFGVSFEPEDIEKMTSLERAAEVIDKKAK